MSNDQRSPSALGDAVSEPDDRTAPGYYLHNPHTLLAGNTQPRALTQSPPRLREHYCSRPEQIRQGDDDWREHPSRIGDMLVYRDGRRVPIKRGES